MDEKTRVENFLKELSELTKKHKIAIAGCGCCGSPFLESAVKGERLEGIYDWLDWDEVAEEYRIQ